MNDKYNEAFEKWRLQYISTHTGYFKMAGTDDLAQVAWQAGIEYSNGWQAAIEYSNQQHLNGTVLKSYAEKYEAEKAKSQELYKVIELIDKEFLFMITLIEKYSTDKEQALYDCHRVMKFRKPTMEKALTGYKKEG